MPLSFNTEAFNLLAENLKSRVTRSDYFERLIDIDQYVRELGGGEEGGWVDTITQSIFGAAKALLNFGLATIEWLLGDFSFAGLFKIGFTRFIILIGMPQMIL
jgi:hypothetical protein